MEVFSEVFGYTKNNEEIKIFTLKNNYLEIELLSYGGIVKSILAPDKSGNMENIALGMDNILDYEERSPYFGALVGRIAGRISNGDFFLGEEHYSLTQNNNNINTIHGGDNNFSKKNWKALEFEKDDTIGVELRLFSSHLEEGFPGNINITVRYTLKNNSLIIEYLGNTDKPTYMNLTNHSYFNLSGNCKTTIENHILQLNADKFTVVDNMTLPVNLKNVTDSPFDFRNPKLLSDALLSKDEQISIVGGGIDHGFIINEDLQQMVSFLKDPISGRTLKVASNQKMVVIYTGNHLDKIGNISGNIPCKKYQGICFETQDYTDIFRFAPDKVTIYDKDKNYYQKTVFTFEID